MDIISGQIPPVGTQISGNISPSGVSVSGLITQAVLRGLSAYQVAVNNGYQGSQEQWIKSLRGENIQFKAEGLRIYYKYESETEWILLVEIDALMADYRVLDHKPSINNVILDGNKTLEQLGIQASYDGYSLVSDEEIERLSHVDNYDDSTITQMIEDIIRNAVTGVRGSAESVYRKGNIIIAPADLGLGNVDNTHDADKNVLSAIQDSEGNVFGETYFNGVSKSGGNAYLTRPDGTSEKILVSDHSHDASEIISGTIDIARLPAAALQRMVDVANRQERYALTKATVQNGDTVRQLDTGIMYRVVDDNKLNKSDGYKEYTAGRAAAVPWSGIEDKPETYTPSAHTHTISQVTDIANASVAEAAKLKTARTIGITGGATANGVQFDGTGSINLNVTALDISLLSGTANINITGNAGTATQFARERTIQVTGKATAAPKVYDGRQNIALEITDLDAAEKNHTHKIADITDFDPSDIEVNGIANFDTSTANAYTDVWFSHSVKEGVPVHNSGLQYNPTANTLKSGTFEGNLTGNATTASALTTSAGSAVQPVYFSNGVPVATTYELNKTVPADAVFTDTHYTSNVIIGGNFNSKTDTVTPISNGNVHVNHIENNVVTSSHRITGTGAATVTTDEYGNIIINSTGAIYEAGLGISVANNMITNTGVRTIFESTTNGNITANINGVAQDIPIKGLKSAAYTESADYAAYNHRHNFSDVQNKPTTLEGYGITDAAPLSHEHDASSITSGTIDIARLPASAVERYILVADQAARFALTKNDVHNGDTVQQEDTGIMYRVIDDNNLNSEAGYKEYTAGAASSVPWSGVTGKPESFIPSYHEHLISEILDIGTATVASAGKLTVARTISITGAVTGSGSFDGSSDFSISTTVNHTHDYAGASTPGGSATSAVKLDSDAGSSTLPVYFVGGKPTATSYSLAASVPANAVFTDTHYVSKSVVASTDNAITDTSSSLANTHVYVNHVENGAVTASHRIIGTGATTVTTDSSGNILINSEDTKYTVLPNPYSISVNGKTYDGSSTVDVGIIDVTHGGTGNSSVDTTPIEGSTKMVTSGGIYTSLSGKSDADHTHLYAGSSTAGGSATSAIKLDSNAGTSTNPVYFSGGKPVATTYSLNATVPADAVFTDTHYASKTVVGGASDATTDTNVSLTNTHVFLNHVENGIVTGSHRISGTGATTVTTDSSGNILINSDDTKYTVLPNPYSLSVNGKTYDGSEAVDTGVIGVAYGGTGNSSVDTTPTQDSTKMVTSGGVYDALLDKSDVGHTHLYAGSSTSGGSATSAVKLDSNAGSSTQPIYFASGKPTACSYALNKTVPADAVFTDTHYTSKTVVASANNASTDTDTSLSNTHVFLNHVQNDAVTASHRITGTGATTVTTDSSGNILVNSTDTKYTELPNPESLIIQGNGTTIDSYKGSTEKTINITYSNVGAAAATHGHSWSDISNTPTTLAGYGITDQLAAKNHIHDASAITSGVFDLARIPVAAIERLVIVDDLTAMYQLTKSEVQIGDTVQCDDTKMMYRVVDDDNLDNASGYKEYTAGSASSVPWSGVTDKPALFPPSEHSHYYAGSSEIGGSANSAEQLNPSTDAGSTTNPVYFSNGKPTACTYSLNKTVPSDAVFTDHITTATVTGAGNAVTDVSADANGDLTITKGSTFSLSNHIHDLSIQTDTGTSAITLDYSGKYKLNAGGKAFIFTMPDSDNTNTHRPINVNSTEILGDNTTPLNLVAGSYITLTNDNSGNVTISSIDTKYTAATATPEDIATTAAVGSSVSYARQDHVHKIDLETGDSSGQVKIAGTNITVKNINNSAYKDFDSKPTYGSTNLITSGGVNSRIAYQKFTLSDDEWSITTYTDGTFGTTGIYRQAISFAGFTANTQIVSIKLVGSQSGTQDNGVFYDSQFSLINEAETGDSLIEFRATTKPTLQLTVVVGYVSETLNTSNTSTELPTNSRFSADQSA